MHLGRAIKTFYLHRLWLFPQQNILFRGKTVGTKSLTNTVNLRLREAAWLSGQLACFEIFVRILALGRKDLFNIRVNYALVRTLTFHV